MASEPWPRTSEVVGEARSLRELFKLDLETLGRALAASKEDLLENDAAAAYDRAWTYAETLTTEVVAFRDSERVFVEALPLVVGMALLRASVVAAHPSSALRSLIDELELQVVVSRALQDRPTDLATASSARADDEHEAAVDDAADEYDMFAGSTREPAIARVAAWNAPHHITRLCDEAVESLRQIVWATEALGNPYFLVSYEWGRGGSIVGWSAAVAAWDLDNVASSCLRAESLDFVNDRPPDWPSGEVAVDALFFCRRFSEALMVLDQMKPTAFTNESPVDEADTSATLEVRTFWRDTSRADAYWRLGDSAQMIATVPSSMPLALDSESGISWRWNRLSGICEGLAHRPNDVAPAELVVRKLDEIHDSQRRMERLWLADRGRHVRLERGVEGLRTDHVEQVALLVDIPEATSRLIQTEWMADRQFERHLESLRRGWRESARLAEHEDVIARLKDAMGDNAWSHLAPTSQDELRAYATIKENWGREHLALSAFALCRTFERELRGALERLSMHTAQELAGMTWGQLLTACGDLPSDDRLNRVAVRIDELGIKKIRDDAVHPSAPISSDRFRLLENTMLRDGLERKGFIRHVVTYQNSGG